MKKLLCFSLILVSTVCAFAQATNTAKVTLAWDPNCSSEIKGYGVYYTTNALSVPKTNIYPSFVDDCGTNRPISTNIYYGNYSTNVVEVVGRTNTTCIVSNLVRGSKYYFIVRSQNFGGLESDDSNEVGFTVPLTPTNSLPTKPEGFRIMSVK